MNDKISRRHFLQSSGAAVLSVMGSSQLHAQAQTTKPNILLIVADDLGYEKLSCYGGLDLKTPNLDRMAESGIRFQNAFTSPVCTPSRMSLYTGTYTPRHKYTEVLPVHLGTQKAVDFSDMPTIANELRQGGYRTSVTGKWQLATLEYHPDHCQSAGFDSWCVWQIWKDGAKTKRYWNPTFNQDGRIRDDIADRFGSDVLTEYVIDRMKAAKGEGKPFFIHHNLFMPHWPIVQTPDDIQHDRPASLDNMIRYMDKQVGRLVDAIHQLGLENDTLVFFVGDNGTDTTTPRKTTEGDVTGRKRDLNNGGMHVPLLAYGPGHIPAGEVKHDLIDMADLHPTICDLAGVEGSAKKVIDGISFESVLTANGQTQREWVTAGVYDDFVVFDGNWRLHHKGEKLFDCRDLPLEKSADPDSSKSREAKQRLLPALNYLRSL